MRGLGQIVFRVCVWRLASRILQPRAPRVTKMERLGHAVDRACCRRPHLVLLEPGSMSNHKKPKTSLLQGPLGAPTRGHDHLAASSSKTFHVSTWRTCASRYCAHGTTGAVKPNCTPETSNAYSSPLFMKTCRMRCLSLPACQSCRTKRRRAVLSETVTSRIEVYRSGWFRGACVSGGGSGRDSRTGGGVAYLSGPPSRQRPFSRSGRCLPNTPGMPTVLPCPSARRGRVRWRWWYVARNPARAESCGSR